MSHLTTEELDAGLDHIRQAPKDDGELQLIVSRPADGEREELEEAELELTVGLVGDNWLERGSPREDGTADLERQLTLMRSRAIDLIAGTPDRWALAGDQLYVDLDLGNDNLPPGTRLGIGSAVIEVTAPPHTGCAKFTKRFGLEAHRWVNTPAARSLNLRGINAKVVTPGKIRTGNRVRKV